MSTCPELEGLSIKSASVFKRLIVGAILLGTTLAAIGGFSVYQLNVLLRLSQNVQSVLNAKLVEVETCTWDGTLCDSTINRGLKNR